ncbi:MAG TPA: cobalamin-independent methionine synthase II family protein [Actinocrinis sp.]|uniref:cobalamin-independent methionine synthase II family protein n=1 Tax=Actinocrinis sp. TaxID=1920516 RepID=UPI002D502CFF|nr:cobalamin-independent methionine synthase II family protein [Actinocrinis sp.]HZU58270.1 cobalamin-independent methionine synthase II family protein [Actinocrinis sp.]
MSAIATTHVGSLVRPPELRPFLLARHHRTPYDEAQFERVLAQCVDDAVRDQVAAGVDIVSDGEFGKTLTWATYIRERLDGFEERPIGDAEPEPQRFGLDRRTFPEFFAEYDRVQFPEGQPERGLEWVCTGPIRYRGRRELRRDIANLLAAAERHGARGAFLPVVAPGSVMPVRRDEYYGTEREFALAVADALRVEYTEIVNASLYVQIDDAYLTMMHDSMVHAPNAGPETVREFREWAELRISSLNRALEGIPPERVRYHVCWGSWNGPHTGDVPLRDIVDLILQVNAGSYAIEQANPRHEHEWAVWEEVALPEGKRLIPGVISHATNIVEHPDLVAERLLRNARLIGADRIDAGTDCGFAQTPFSARVHPSIMWAKLRALAEGARIASKTLGLT